MITVDKYQLVLAVIDIHKQLRAIVQSCAILLCIIGSSQYSFSQEEARFGIGHSFVDDDLLDGREYGLWIAIAGFKVGSRHLGERMHLNTLVELHYGNVSTISGERHDFDLAFNLAAEFEWQFHKAVGVHLAIGSGPGYQSTKSKVQARGLLFSNNFTLGFRYTLRNKSVTINPQIRFRHMSNAHLNSPNGGLDNFFALLTIAIPLTKKDQ